MWIKICGMTTHEAVDAAIGAGAQAVGFVFAPSVRRISIERANQLARAARGKVECVAVFRAPDADAVSQVLEGFRPDIVQADAASLRALADARVLRGELQWLPVLRDGETLPAVLPARALYEGPVSGSGLQSDWVAARELASRTQIVLAGGLSPDNVAAAILAVRPVGVDVSSGVESRPGVKSASRIERFVSAARQAAMENG